MLLVGGLATGCSSGVSRFTDGMFTGSTANQRSIISPQSQPFPGDVAAVRPAPVDDSYTGSVARAAVEPAPVVRQNLPPAGAQPAAVAPEPVAVAQPAPMPQPAQPASQPAEDIVHEGWSRAGGTQVTLKQGETLNILSRRFGVPVNAIMKVNGIANANSVGVGQKIVVPTYVYSQAAPVSAPDNVRSAPATNTPQANRTQPGDTPRPAPRPDNVAVLPQQPKLKEPDARPQAVDGTVAGAPRQNGGSYTVVAGDSLHAIARKTGVGVDTLRRANNLDAESRIRIGQTLAIPAGGATVAAAPRSVDPVITGTPGPAKKAAVPKAEAAAPGGYTPPRKNDAAIKAAVEADSAKAPDRTGIDKMRWPVRGRVIGTYGNSSGSAINDGIDIAVPEGTPVKAAENGVVIFAGEGLKDFGKTVLVRHADGKVTVYGHTSEIKVNRGDNVRRGQEIARSGMSGKAETPKLHFEVRVDSNPVDPQQFLE